jgi:hypothetical protein
MASYQEQRTEAHHNGKQDKPSPLRIVKRCRGNGYDDDSGANTNASVSDNDSDTWSITGNMKQLHVSKKRAHGYNSSAQGFWASSVDLRHHQTRSWEEALSRCRGLLRRSTPNLGNYKRYLMIGRSYSSRTQSSGRMSSTCSSQSKKSTDCYRASSTSS